ncbi:hypothetical protein RirG_142200 [Rhizophagus irregularis DAOM 197198w]|uniref:Uncharacterized protein n=1 Tax=Rhizophagus irregularis (strain DAOM 197198w) TaxID=1432141 RepID=A0A015MCE0_RHIIW|nr:hypothetical protein RirG_142200 [Rhizophagus irregularis DAOM 197198w]
MGFGMGWNMGFSQFHYIGGKYSEDSNEMDNEEETDESVKVGEILNPEDDEYSDEYNLEKEPEK